MTFEEARDYLLSLGNEVSAMKLGLESMTKLLDALCDPQKNYLKVQVAGTNGKGSVCAFLDSICRSAGLESGLFTSPHLVSITERVQINGSPITESEFAKFARQVRKTSEELVDRRELTNVPTFFEQVTAIALVAFADYGVPIAILETGLGGRLDAATAATAEIAAISRIDLDHQEYLGDTIEKIASEKAAIIHRGSIVCVGRQFPEAYEMILGRCKELHIIPNILESAAWDGNGELANFEVGGSRYENVAVSLAGEHQLENAALAILTAQQLRNFPQMSDKNIVRGLEAARHPGRLEFASVGRVQILFDGAHNLSGARALADYLRRRQNGAQIALVYGSMSDKDYFAILEILLPLVRDVIFTRSTNSRSVSASDLARSDVVRRYATEPFAIESVSDALDAAIQLADTYPSTRPAIVLVTGSLYLVGEAKAIL